MYGSTSAISSCGTSRLGATVHGFVQAADARVSAIVSGGNVTMSIPTTDFSRKVQNCGRPKGSIQTPGGGPNRCPIRTSASLPIPCASSDASKVSGTRSATTACPMHWRLCSISSNGNWCRKNRGTRPRNVNCHAANSELSDSKTANTTQGKAGAPTTRPGSFHMVQVIHEGGAPIKAWIDGVSLEDSAKKQLINVASLPFIHHHLAAMPDVH